MPILSSSTPVPPQRPPPPWRQILCSSSRGLFCSSVRQTVHGVLRPGRAEQPDQPPHHTLGDIALDHNLVFRFADITQVNHPTLSASMKCLGRLENLAYGSSASRIFPETVHPNVVNSSIVPSPSTSAPMDTLHNWALAA